MAGFIIRYDKVRKVMDTRQINLRMGEGGNRRKNDYIGINRCKK